jgi:phosphatidylglycerol---prolipoprotein diacylglyceryl transferase
MQFPNINPVILPIGPFAISWYSLSYVAGILLGWLILNKIITNQINSQKKLSVTKKNVEDYVTWAIISIILGGRIGYVAFYNPAKYLNNPIEILKTYEGGMSFHGGMTGLLLATYFFCKKNNVKFFELTDLCAIVAPIGIFFGRVANFINAELLGKVTNMPWGIVFPHTNGLPRHPSQLYEAILEGLVLFCIMLYSSYKYGIIKNTNDDYRTKKTSTNQFTSDVHSNIHQKSYGPGKLSGVFLCFYAFFRILVEFFREPDVTLGYIYNTFTMGQLLCLPMMIFGIYLVCSSSTKNIR